MIAFDTNVLIYAEDPNDRGGRHDRAASILSRLAMVEAMVPVQVLGEFINVCRKKALISPDLAMRKVANYAQAFDTPQTEVADIQQASLIAGRYNLQFFDALIIAVAMRSGATVLLSEDMHDGLQIEGLAVLNPFNPANAERLALLFDPDA